MEADSEVKTEAEGRGRILRITRAATEPERFSKIGRLWKARFRMEYWKVKVQPGFRSGQGRCGQWRVVRDISLDPFLPPVFSSVQGSYCVINLGCCYPRESVSVELEFVFKPSWLSPFPLFSSSLDPTLFLQRRDTRDAGT